MDSVQSTNSDFFSDTNIVDEISCNISIIAELLYRDIIVIVGKISW